MSKTFIIPFAPASGMPELLAPDGELLDAEEFFPEDDSSSSSGSSQKFSTLPVPLPAMVAIPADVRVLLLSGSDNDTGSGSGYGSGSGSDSGLRIILQCADGALELRAAPGFQPRRFAPSGFQRIRQAVEAGDLLFLIPDSDPPAEPFIARRTTDSYTVPAPFPTAPKVSWALTPAAMGSYCVVAGEYPSAVIEVPCPASLSTTAAGWLRGETASDTYIYDKDFISLKKEVEQAVSDLWQTMVSEAAVAGLHLLPFIASLHLQSGEDTVAVSSPQLLNDNLAPLMAAVSEVSATEGLLKMRITFNRKPSRLKARVLSLDIPSYLYKESLQLRVVFSQPASDLAEGVGLGGLHNIRFSGDAERRRGWSLAMLPPGELPRRLSVADAAKGRLPMMVVAAIPTTVANDVEVTASVGEGIVQVDSRLLGGFATAGAYRFGNRLLMFGGGLLRTASVASPLMAEAVTPTDGKIRHLLSSFRALSSGQFGEFPLYSFSADGIRALTPDAGGFRSVQLLSRDIPVDGTSPVMLTSGVAFMSPRGLAILSGTAVSVVNLPENLSPVSVKGVAYHYASDSILAWTGATAYSYEISAKEWHTLEFGIAEAHESWPELYLLSGGGVRRLVAETMTIESDAAEKSHAIFRGPSGRRLLMSRALKFGDTYRPKWIREVMLLPGGKGEDRYLRLEASNDLEHWHPLGESVQGRLRLYRGSPWLWYRVAIAASAPLPPALAVKLRMKNEK